MQLHISEKSGRGVPRIIGAYGEDAFRFSDNAITVTIPFDRLDLGDAPQDTPQDIPQEKDDTVEERILYFCTEARSTQEILGHLGLKDRKNLMGYLRRLAEQGRIAMTIPDKPTSRNQKYITIR